MPDHYKILGVPRDADRHTVQAAYRRLARRHHPDFGGDPRIMALLNEAWWVLGDASRRETYEGASPRRHTRRQPIVTPEPAGPLAAAAERRRQPDPHRPTETTLDFGRYAGWTIPAVAMQDPEYLEWLMRSQAGRMYRAEIVSRLRERREGQPPTALKERPRRTGSRFRRHR